MTAPPIPTKREQEAIQNLRDNAWFRTYLAYRQRVLDDVRIANDTLPADEIQIGQGMARAIAQELTLFKDPAKAGSD